MLLHSVFYCWIMDRGRCRVFSPTCEECSANAWCHREHCFKNKWQNGALLHLFSSNSVKTLESLPLLEMRTNSCDEKPIKWCLDAFLKDEKEWYGYNVSTAPLNFTCNMSWPIIKTPLRVFNNESIEEYCQRSYTIATGNATSKEPLTTVSKTFIHLYLSHVINRFSRRSKRYFKRIERTFATYWCSLLANADTWGLSKNPFITL